MKFASVGLVTLLVVIGVVSADWGFLSCKMAGKLPEFESLDLEDFIGEWHVVREPKKGIFGFLMPSCPTKWVHYLGFGGYTVTTLETAFLTGWRMSHTVSITKGFFLIDIPFVGWLFGNSYKLMGTSMFQVVDTDYNNYAVIYSCVDGPLWLWHSNDAWLWSRQNWLDQMFFFRAEDILRDYNYKSSKEWKDDMGKKCDQGIAGLG